MISGLDALSFSEDFFCEEVRDGFYISEAMKRYWAAQLQVLSVIDRICRKHQCNWYADSGTLIGAIRHKGYIPWDDDVDIAMPREDMERFLTFARAELPEGYMILSSDDDEGYTFTFCRIINGDAIDTHQKYLSEHFGCPFSAGVDIFPLDKIFNDRRKEEERDRRGYLVYSTMEGMLAKTLTDKDILSRVSDIEKLCGVTIGTDDVYRKLLSLFNDIARECDDDDSSELALMYEWIHESKCRFRKECYDRWTEMPFETTLIRVPEGYDEILTSYYGDYMKAVRGAAIHEYPAYRECEEIFRKDHAKNPCRYYFDKDKFLPESNRKTLVEQQKELLRLVHEVLGKLNYIASTGNKELVVSMLQTCQNTAISVGNTLEGKFGTGLDALKRLEWVCERLYEAAQNWDDELALQVDEAILDIESDVDELFQKAKRDILFLPCKASWWDSLLDVYNEAVSDDRNEVKVIPLPYYYHDNSGILGESRIDDVFFQKQQELADKITNFEEYNAAGRHPDVIVIQFPYNEFSTILGIPKMYFSENLLQYTDRLVFVPHLSPDEPTSDDDIAFSAMTYLVEQPAVFDSDVIVVKTAGLREYYIKKLVEMTGIDLRSYWENKVRLKEDAFK